MSSDQSHKGGERGSQRSTNHQVKEHVRKMIAKLRDKLTGSHPFATHSCVLLARH